MLIIGHRGAKAYAPENTLLSFQKALEMGVDAIELDVYVAITGEVVLMHDHKVDRTTNGRGYIFEKSFAEIRSLDAGNNERVPTLQEVLDMIEHRVPVNIELKGPGTADPVAAIMQQYIAERGWKTLDFMVSSFNHHELQNFHALMPDVPIGALMDAIPLSYAAFAEELGATYANPGHEFVTKEYVDDAHSRGLKVLVWTVDDPDDVARMYHMGVDGIFTNAPDVARIAMEDARRKSAASQAVAA